MLKNQFYNYYITKNLESLSTKEALAISYISAKINIYPFQIESTNFAINSYYSNLGGCILCDESGLGKSHEAMLIISQLWLSSYYKIMIVIPNKDLLNQWVHLIEEYYTIPIIILTSNERWDYYLDERDNPFNQNAIIITTQKFLYYKQDFANQIDWNLIVFEEATTLSSIYKDSSGGSIAKSLKEISKNSFKLLLTGTPIEKNIMDLYGLIYFIDDNTLGNEYDFLKRYLRKPENYPELASVINPYCFRTTRSSIREFANITQRQHLTFEFIFNKQEQTLYNLILEYSNKESKVAYPEIDTYDLNLKLLSIFSSSAIAIKKTFNGVLDRLSRLEQTEEVKLEVEQIQNIVNLASKIKVDTKTIKLLEVLKNIFSKISNKKVLIFIENLETQYYLYKILKEKYSVILYNGEKSYSSIKEFKENKDINILISTATDSGARGFNIQECSVVIHYDLLYNTLKMEQRIDRCHRLGQKEDIINICLINKANLSDVRKLELIKKRLLLSDGVVGISDNVIGGFTENIEEAIKNISTRTPKQIQDDYKQNLKLYKESNLNLVEDANNLLFTKFNPELAEKIVITPEYLEEKSKKFNNKIWEVVKIFFNDYNARKNSIFSIDDEKQVVMLTNHEKLPMLFYYNSGKQSRPYYSLKSYGLNDDFKPLSNRLTLTSPLVRGILDNVACSNFGNIKLVNKNIKTCKIGLYIIIDIISKKEYLHLIGLTEDNNILSNSECLNILKLPIIECLEDGTRSPRWLKQSTKLIEADELDNYLDIENIISTPACRTPKDSFNLKKDSELVTLEQDLKNLEIELLKVQNDKMQKLALTRKINKLKTSIKNLKASSSVPVSSSKDISNINPNIKVMREFLVYIN